MTTPESHTEQYEKNENETLCYSKLAREGISLMLNNKQNEAERLFKTYPENIQMNAGFAFAVVTDALMTFEDDKLQLAFQTLKDLEKKCSATLTFLQQDISGYFKGGWILRKSYKLYQQAYTDILNLYNEIVGDGNTPVQMAKQDKQSTLQVTDNNAGSIPQSVATPSIPADAVSVPVANGTIDTAPLDNFKTINVDNNRTILPEIGTSGAITSPAENNAAETVLQNSNPTQPYTVLNDTQACTPLEGPNYPIHNENQNTTPSPQNKNGKDIDKETISRLLCAVSFGYGLLQLGFGGNRKNGLDNLMFARLGTDMRAPFATLALLWYHTIVRPFFALDGNHVEAGVEAAARLIEEIRDEYGESSLFLFFKGRLERLNSDIPEAIKAFQTSIHNAAQREIKMMSMHEVGWCYLIQLDFEKSENTFSCLRQSSRWSRPFYSYLTIISAGSTNIFQTTNDVIEARNIFQPVPKGTQLDEFLNRRYKICPLEVQ
ncbi:Iml2/Tetratricopeptide repeat protein 39 [Popillia japonica]|uniref:Iml2/Tetratricopeptide repeat protein 39 n=1 Tax=Popillia japonica TaxID=7064 RepID=A0AAW1LR93_POPJA